MSRLTIHLIPNAATTEVVGQEGRAWKIRIAAPPIEGKANKALITFLANILDTAPSTIDLLKGQGSKTKIIDVPLDEETVAQALQKQTR